MVQCTCISLALYLLLVDDSVRESEHDCWINDTNTTLKSYTGSNTDDLIINNNNNNNNNNK